MGEVRLIDAGAAVDNADKRYDEWNLAMAAAEGSREINMVYKKQELFKAVKKVVDSCPTIDPESLRPVSRWDSSGKYTFADKKNSIAVRCENCGCALHMRQYKKYVWKFCPVCGARMEGE